MFIKISTFYLNFFIFIFSFLQCLIKKQFLISSIQINDAVACTNNFIK